MSFLVFAKPDAAANNTAGQILAKFKTAGFKIVQVKAVAASRELAEAHYAEHQGAPETEHYEARQ